MFGRAKKTAGAQRAAGAQKAERAQKTARSHAQALEERWNYTPTLPTTRALIGAGLGLLVAWAKGPSGDRWMRTSYSGGEVSLSEGVEVVGALVGSTLARPSVRISTGCPIASKAREMGALSLASAAGYIDDHMENAFPDHAKGLKGHLSALAHGRPTSGVLKIALIGGAAAIAPRYNRRGGFASWAADSVIIAGTANLINLLDLRPGRALKVVGAGALGGLACRRTRPGAAGLLVAVGSALPSDLAGATMLGDLGANALGLELGRLATAPTSLKTRLGLAAGVVGLTLASEKISFSKVIENTPILRTIDHAGRRD